MPDQKKLKLHKIEVRQKPEMSGNNIQTGASTQVFMDGQLLRGVSFFKFEVKAAGVAKVTMEMFADVDIEVETALPHKELKGTGYKKIDVQGKERALAVYEISSYSPKQIVASGLPGGSGAGCANAEADKKPYCDGCGCGKKAAYEKKNG